MVIMLHICNIMVIWLLLINTSAAMQSAFTRYNLTRQTLKKLLDRFNVNTKDTERRYPATFVLMKRSSRQLDQGEYVRPYHASPENVMSSEMSSGSLLNVLIKTSIFVLVIRLLVKTSSRRLQGILKTC